MTIKRSITIFMMTSMSENLNLNFFIWLLASKTKLFMMRET